MTAAGCGSLRGLSETSASLKEGGIGSGWVEKGSGVAAPAEASRSTRMVRVGGPPLCGAKKATQRKNGRGSRAPAADDADGLAGVDVRLVVGRGVVP